MHRAMEGPSQRLASPDGAQLACPRDGQQRGNTSMKRIIIASAALAVGLWSAPVSAAEKLIISSWGGSWKDLIEQTIAKKFKADTGAEVEFITGGTIDRLNKAKLAKGNPESDITFTTSHVGWLYANDGLYETLDLDKIPNAKSLVRRPRSARSTSAHGPMSTPSAIARTGARPGMTFETWADLWKPGAQRQDFGARFRRQPSRGRCREARGRRCGDLGKGQRQAQGAQAELQGLLCQRRCLAAAYAERRSAGAGDAVDECLLHRQPGRECEARDSERRCGARHRYRGHHEGQQRMPSSPTSS